MYGGSERVKVERRLKKKCDSDVRGAPGSGRGLGED